MGLLSFLSDPQSGVAPGQSTPTPTQAQIDAQRKLAMALMGQAADTSPLYSPWQAAARVAQGLVGGYEERKARSMEQAKEGEADRLMKQYNSAGLAPAGGPGPQGPGVASPAAPGDQGVPPSIRTNNPGAMWPGPSATKFGSNSYENLRDGNKIAKFDSPQQGAAAQFDLMASPGYAGGAGIPLGSLIYKWSGGNATAAYTKYVADQVGLKPDTVITSEMLRDPKIGIPLARSAAHWEAGRPSPLTDEQWTQGHQLAFAPQGAGAATAPSSNPTAPSLASPRPGFANTPGAMDTERERQQEAILARAATREGPLQAWALKQLEFVNQKKTLFGLEHEKGQIQRQLALEQAWEQQRQDITAMVGMGLLRQDQAAMMLGPRPGSTPAQSSQPAQPGGPAPAPAPQAQPQPPQATASLPSPTNATLIGGAPSAVPGTSVAGAPGASTAPVPSFATEGPGSAPPQAPLQAPPSSPPGEQSPGDVARGMIKFGAFRNRPAMVSGGEQLLKNDPDVIFRSKTAEHDAQQSFDTYKKIQDSAAEANDLAANINDFKNAQQLYQAYGSNPGIGGDYLLSLRKIGIRMGLADAESAAPGELMKKIGMKLATGFASGTPGFSRITQSELQGFQRSVASIENTPKANEYILAAAERSVQLRRDLAELASRYKASRGGLDSGFDVLARELERRSGLHSVIEQLNQEPEVRAAAEASSKAAPSITADQLKQSTGPVWDDKYKVMRQYNPKTGTMDVVKAPPPPDYSNYKGRSLKEDLGSLLGTAEPGPFNPNAAMP